MSQKNWTVILVYPGQTQLWSLKLPKPFSPVLLQMLQSHSQKPSNEDVKSGVKKSDATKSGSNQTAPEIPSSEYRQGVPCRGNVPREENGALRDKKG